jgi:hypothetical protein
VIRISEIYIVHPVGQVKEKVLPVDREVKKGEEIRLPMTHPVDRVVEKVVGVQAAKMDTDQALKKLGIILLAPQIT